MRENIRLQVCDRMADRLSHLCDVVYSCYTIYRDARFSVADRPMYKMLSPW